jgi:hypothetical protein
MARDMGLALKTRIHVDATAGKGIASRRGCGKIRHLHTQTLWVQRAVGDKVVELCKVDGLKNVADLGTKHLDRQRMWTLMAALSCFPVQGRSSLALKAEV